MLIWHFCYKTLAVTNIVCFWLHNQARVNLASLNPLYQMWGLTSPMWVIPQDNKESSNEQNIFRYKSARHIKHLLFFLDVLGLGYFSILFLLNSIQTQFWFPWLNAITLHQTKYIPMPCLTFFPNFRHTALIQSHKQCSKRSTGHWLTI
jgi:hypothetical protein